MSPLDYREPLAAHRLFRTRDLDEARAIVAGKFCDHRLNIAAHEDCFDACHHRVEGRTTSLNYIRYGADVIIEPGELESFYLIQIPLAGAAEIDNRGGEVQTRQGLGSVLNPHRDTRMRWREGCAQFLLQIDATALAQEAERLLGSPLTGPITFETAVDETRPGMADWVRKLRTCFGLAEQRAIFGSDNAGTQLRVERELISEFLQSQPSNISAQIVAAAPGRAAHIHLRRALHFIRQNLHKPIAVADIAEAAGTSPRSLQLCFQAELNLTPMRYLRQQRLIHARALILSAGPDEMLGDIAFRAGFSHFGRFSGEYRKYFGESPSETRQTAIAGLNG